VIVDSSALTSIMLREKKAEQIIKIIVEEKPYTLPLAIKETINASWKRYIMGEITNKDVENVSEQLLALINKRALILLNQDTYIAIATKIAVDNKITVYDSLFIAAAYKESDRLLTFDNKQSKVAERLGVRVITL
jgi:predicted nucleic acid-binding protein